MTAFLNVISNKKLVFKLFYLIFITILIDSLGNIIISQTRKKSQSQRNYECTRSRYKETDKESQFSVFYFKLNSNL